MVRSELSTAMDFIPLHFLFSPRIVKICNDRASAVRSHTCVENHSRSSQKAHCALYQEEMETSLRSR